MDILWANYIVNRSQPKHYSDIYGEFRVNSPTRSESGGRLPEYKHRAVSPSTRSEIGAWREIKQYRGPSPAWSDSRHVSGARRDMNYKDISPHDVILTHLTRSKIYDDSRPDNSYQVMEAPSMLDENHTNVDTDQLSSRYKPDYCVNDQGNMKANVSEIKSLRHLVEKNHYITDSHKSENTDQLAGTNKLNTDNYKKKRQKYDKISGKICISDKRFLNVNSKLIKVHSNQVTRSQSTDDEKLVLDKGRSSEIEESGSIFKSGNLNWSEKGKEIVNMDAMRKRIYKLKNEIENGILLNRQGEINKEANVVLLKKLWGEEEDVNKIREAWVMEKKTALEMLKRKITEKNVKELKQNEGDEYDYDQYQEDINNLENQITKLKERLKDLTDENAALRSNNEGVRQPLEQKIKGLKRQNGELATIARQLEEKNKNLQEEHIKKCKDSAYLANSDHMKRMFAQQRAKDLADYAKNMLMRDKEIKMLHSKCQELAEQIGATYSPQTVNGEVYNQEAEMVNLVKQSAKERLVLEKQLSSLASDHDTHDETISVAQNQIRELTVVNYSLQEEVSRLKKLSQESSVHEAAVHDKDEECSRLVNQVQTVSRHLNAERNYTQQLLEDECSCLKSEVSKSQDLCKQKERLVSSILSQLSQAQEDRDESRQTVLDLHVSINKFESHIKILEQQKNDVESKNQTLLTKLQQKDEEIIMLEKNQNALKEKDNDLQDAQIKLQELSGELNSLQQKYANSDSSRNTVDVLISSACQTEDIDSHSLPSLHHILIPYHKEVTELMVYPAPAVKHIIANLDADSVPSFRSDTILLQVINNHTNSLLPQTSFLTNTVSDRIRQFEALDCSFHHQGNAGEEWDISNSVQDSKHPSTLFSKSHLDQDMMDNSDFAPNKFSTPMETVENRPHVQIYIAKYSYDPQEYSPNDQPEAELPLNAGDYLVVYDDMDEDGFFSGELMDGRSGLVPSNFIEKVSDHDLTEFYNAMSSSVHAHSLPSIDITDDTLQTQHSQYLSKSMPASDSGAFDESGEALTLTLSDMTSWSDTSTKYKKKGIPFPINIKLERQLTNSILMSWAAPDDAKNTQIQAYHVYIDKKFRTSVHGTERTKALVEGVSSKEIHRVSVRTVTSRGQSDLAQCTLLVGKGATAEPSNLIISSVSPVSATLTWLPGDSNCHHVIYLNGSEYRVLKPGICKHEIIGLTPRTHYALVLQARPHIEKITDCVVTNNCRDLSASLNFSTLAAGLPETPLDVQVEAGPRHGTLLVMWLPVSISPTSVSNGAPVTGYAIYADNVKVMTVVGSTNDHAVLSSIDLRGVGPSTITVTTVSHHGSESEASRPVHLSTELMTEVTGTVSKHYTMVASGQQVRSGERDQVDGGECGEEQNTRSHDNEPETLDAVVASEMADDSSHSELSDIQEEEEDEEDDGRHKQRHVTTSPQPTGRSSKAGVSRKEGTRSTESHSESAKAMVPTQHLSVMSHIVPAIEITRDSSSEKEGSFDKHETDDQSCPNSPDRQSNDKHVEDRRKYDQVIEGPAEKVHPSSITIFDNSPSQAEKKPRPNDNVLSRSTESIPTSRATLSSHNPEGSQAGPNLTDDPNSDLTGKQHFHNYSQNLTYDTVVSNSRENPSLSSALSTSQERIQGYSKQGYDSPRSIEKNGDDYPNVNQRQEPQKFQNDPESNPSINHSANNINNHLSGLSNGDKLNDSMDSIQELMSNTVFTKKRIRDDIPESELIDYEDNGDGDSMIEGNDLSDQVRLFIALFDYDPATMSPNIDTAHEELPFKEGQLIKVHGNQDSDGFFRGEYGSSSGYVPCNMVSEVQVDDPDIEAQLMKESMIQHHHAKKRDRFAVTSQDSLLSPSSNPSIPTSIPSNLTNNSGGTPRRMVALYDYDPKELSPNVDSEVELVFKKGEYINVYGEMDDDGFFMGELSASGIRGLVPSNFLHELSPAASDDEVIDSASVVSRSHSVESLSTYTAKTASTEKISSLDTTSPIPSAMTKRQYNHPIQLEPVTNMDTISPSEEKKVKKKGLLAKGKNIFKKLTR